MSFSRERPDDTSKMGTDETCPQCGYKHGHNVKVCPLVLTGRAKPMAGLSPETVERLRTQQKAH
jgi:hypothetical protein